MRLNFIPLATALLPIFAVHASYLLAANLGHVSWCFPYFPDCVSISATGRHSPESFVFRAAMIPTAVFMFFYWRLSFAWIKALGAQKPRLNRAMLQLGLTASFGLFIYASVMGEIGESYRLQRRIGMILFYVFTYLAQLLMTVQVRAFRSLAAISGAVTVLGILSFLSWGFYDDYRRYEDMFEWTITFLLLGHVFATYFAWRNSGFRARFSVTEA